MRISQPLARLRGPLSALALLLTLGLGACRTYADHTAAAFTDFRRGHFEAARSAFELPETTDSGFLRGA